MEEDVKSIGDYFSIGWRRKYSLIIPIILLSVVTIVVVKLLPPVYRSTGTILIESQQIPQEYIQSTVTGFADERIQIIKQRIMTSRQLMAIVAKFNLIDEEMKNTSQTGIVEGMRNRIFIDLISANVRGSGRRASASIAFSVAFEDRYPKVAQQVANEIVTLFLDQNLKSRQESASETTEFLSKEANRLQSEIVFMEERIAQYRLENAGRLPENLAISLGRVDDLRDRLFDHERERVELTNKRVLLQIELDNTPRDLPAGVSASGTDLTANELIQLQNEFVKLSSRYGADHPDVKALKRQIAAYEKEYGRSIDKTPILEQIIEAETELKDAKQKYTEDHPDIKRLYRKLEGLKSISVESDDKIADKKIRANPKYLRISARLDALNQRLDAMQVIEKEIGREKSNLNVKIQQTPQVQRGLDVLLRDYDNTRKKYQEMKAKELQAELSMSLEESQKGERFTLLEPPLLPTKPIKPDRTKLALVGILISIFTGVGIVVLAEVLDRGIYGARHLAKVTKLTPLVTVPYISTQSDEIKRRRKIQIGLVCGLASTIAILLLTHIYFRPIDIMWYQLIQKLDLG